MPRDHTVRAGECISSIAERYGRDPDSLWDHADNEDLKALREDPNVLQPGDVVVIPDLAQRKETCSTGQMHSFRRKGVPAVFRLQLMEDDEPRSNVPYTLSIDGQQFSGQTDPEGMIEHSIPPDAKKGKLVLDGSEEFDLQLGALDPVKEKSGARARLENLGLMADGPGGGDEDLAESLKVMQEQHGLKPTGELDDATQQKLVELHGS